MNLNLTTHGTINLAVFLIYPLLIGTGLATFIPEAAGMPELAFWLGVIFGNIGILLSITNLKLLQPITTGLMSGGFAVLLGMYGIGLFIETVAPGHLFISLIITLGIVIFLAHKKTKK